MIATGLFGLAQLFSPSKEVVWRWRRNGLASEGGGSRIGKGENFSWIGLVEGEYKAPPRLMRSRSGKSLKMQEIPDPFLPPYSSEGLLTPIP